MDPQYDPLLQNTRKGKKIFKIMKNTWFALGVFVTIVMVIGIGFLIWAVSSDELFAPEEDASNGATTSEQTTESKCNVAVVVLRGDIVTYKAIDANGEQVDSTASEDICQSIESIEEDESVKATILEVDSYGGHPVAAEEIANSLKRAKKPIVGLIRGAATSGGYWAISGADIIFASKNSDVGGIGITMSYLDYSNQNKKEGITYNELSTGKFKDAGDPEKTLTVEERKYFERDLNIMLNNFISDVAKNRNLSITKIKSLADGSSILGEQALKEGLIDKIGDLHDVTNYLKAKIGTDVKLCWE